MVGYNLRFHPGLERLRELVKQHAIGKVVSARAEVGEYLPDWHPWEDYRRGYSARRDLGGGPVLTFSHELDALCWLLGAPSRVMGMATHASSLEIDTEDVAELVLQFADGPLASVHVDFAKAAQAQPRDRWAKKAFCAGSTMRDASCTTLPRHVSGESKRSTGGSSATICTWPSCAISSAACAARSSGH